MLGKIEGRIPCRDLFCMVSASFFFILFPFLQITFQANLKKDTRKEFRILCHLMIVLDSCFFYKESFSYYGFGLLLFISVQICYSIF